MKISYNSPVILSISLLSLLFLILEIAGIPLIRNLASLPPSPPLTEPMTYLRMLLYILGHASTMHLFSNLTIILLVGPMVEEKYGSSRLLRMVFITAISTALLNTLLFSTGILGASGIAFMLITLGSITNFREREIPLTFVLVFLLFVGREVQASFTPDMVSQFAHIIGGLCGAFFGFKSGSR